MATAKLFKTGRSQAVRLPKECRFDTDEVCAVRIGEVLVLYPPGKAWDLFERGLRNFTDDFMAERSQPGKTDQRKSL